MLSPEYVCTESKRYNVFLVKTVTLNHCVVSGHTMTTYTLSLWGHHSCHNIQKTKV